MTAKNVKIKKAKSEPYVSMIFGNKLLIAKAMIEHKIVTKADPAAFTFVGNSSPASAHGMLANPEKKNISYLLLETIHSKHF